MKREDFVSDLAWERYVEERSCCRKLYQKQGFWCLAIVILFIIVAAIKTVLSNGRVAKWSKATGPGWQSVTALLCKPVGRHPSVVQIHPRPPLYQEV